VKEGIMYITVRATEERETPKIEETGLGLLNSPSRRQTLPMPDGSMPSKMSAS